VAVEADRAVGNAVMFLARLLVDAVAGEASNAFTTEKNDIADVFLHMSVGRIQLFHRGGRQIDAKIAKQIVADNEVVGVEQAGRFRDAGSQMTLSAG
jgi:hypothetical protein